MMEPLYAFRVFLAIANFLTVSRCRLLAIPLWIYFTVKMVAVDR